jgi:hypothetical protein
MIEKLKAALAALEAALSDDQPYIERCKQAIPDLRSVIAEMEAREPVAWMWQHDETGRVGFIDIPQLEAGWAQANPRLKCIAPVYTYPQPKAEPLK